MAWIASASLWLACWADIEPEGAGPCQGALCGADVGSGLEAVTFYGDALPIFDRACLQCHTSGGVGAFLQLGIYDDAKEVAPVICDFVTDGVMPPWPPDPTCRSYQHERLLVDDEAATLCAWADTVRELGAEAARGNEADYVPVQREDPLEGLPEPIAIGFGDPYTPTAQPPDDYRCFLLGEEPFAEETFVIASDVDPGAGALVHHVLVYEMTEDLIPMVVGWDAADASATEADPDDDPLEPGYPCFGGPGFNNQGPLAGWVPGSVPIRFPPGSAYRIAAGSRLLMQIHYNSGNSPPVPDATRIELFIQDDDPTLLARLQSLAVKPLVIPAGNANAVNRATFPNPLGDDVTIAGLLPHMHLLGTSIEAMVRRADGGDECLISIPEWDFHWQQLYWFNDDEHIVLASGDSIEVTCTYDNSAENQPILCDEAGSCSQTEPRDVPWGENTTDEMCLVFVAALLPFEREGTGDAPPASRCPTFQGCYDGCVAEPEGGLVQCVLECSLPDGLDCLQCTAIGLDDCLRPACGTQLDELRTCVGGCLDADDRRACLLANCVDEGGAFQTCATTDGRVNACDPYLAACGIHLAETGE